MKVCGVNGTELTKSIQSFNNSMAFLLSDKEAQNLLEVQKRLNLKVYHPLNVNVMGSSLISYLVVERFPFIQHVNDITHRLNNAGLIDKWDREYKAEAVQEIWKKQFSRQTKIQADTNEFTVPTIVWCGWITSVMVFICEIIWCKCGFILSTLPFMK